MGKNKREKAPAEPAPATKKSAATDSSTLSDQALALAKGSVLFQMGTQMPAIWEQAKGVASKRKDNDDDLDACADFSNVAGVGEKQESEAMESLLHLGHAVSALGAGKPAAKPETSVPGKEDAVSLCKAIAMRLSITNPLGVFATGDESVKSFLVMTELEFDGGPRSKKKGSPVLDRLSANGRNHFLQYITVVWALMVLRSVIRSFFACLPWFFVLQTLAVMLFLEKSDLVQLPLEKIPTEFRVMGTFFVHSLMWLFFVYEFIVKAWWLEWFLAAAIIGGHAYAFRPLEA